MMNNIVTAVERNLKSENIKYYCSETSDSKIFYYDLHHKGIFNVVRIIMFVEQTNVQIYSVCPMDADPDNTEQMSRLSEFICRINMRMKMGHFDLNPDDGHIRYATSVYCNGGVPDEKSINAARLNAFAMMVSCAAGIGSLLLTDISAKEAFEKALR